MSEHSLYVQQRKIFQEIGRIWRDRLAREAELESWMEQRLKEGEVFKEEMMSKLSGLDEVAEDLVKGVVERSVGESKKERFKNIILYHSQNIAKTIKLSSVSQIDRLRKEIEDLRDKVSSKRIPHSTNLELGCGVLLAGALIGIPVFGIAIDLGLNITISFLGVVLTFILLTVMFSNERKRAIMQVAEVIARIKALSEQGPTLINRHYEQTVNDIRKQYDAKLKQMTENFVYQMRNQLPLIKSFTQSIPPTLISWQEDAWRAWQPTEQQASQRPPVGVGTFRIIESVTAPALLPLPNSHSLLIKAGGAAREQAIPAIQSLLLRLLATIPPGKAHFTFIDPIGLGQNVAPFMRLADYDEQLVTYRAWSEPAHIEQRLAELTEHMENVIQKYLRNEYATIEEYNAQAGEIAEPYRFLVVFDFPTNFSEDAARRLLSIAQNGPRCGVYAIVLADPTKEMPHGFNLADLERACTVISWNGEHFVWEDEDFRHCVLELDTPPEPELFNRILDAVGEAAKEASKVEVPFERIAPPPEQWWTGDSREGIRVPLGPAGARRLQYLDLGKGTAQHAPGRGPHGRGQVHPPARAHH